MKKMRLFPKTFLYTMILMCVIILVSQVLLYCFMPSVYVNHKNKNLNALCEQAIEEMDKTSLEEIFERAKALSERYDANIVMNVDNTSYIFSSAMQIHTTSEVSLSSDATINEAITSPIIPISNDVGIPSDQPLYASSIFSLEGLDSTQHSTSTIMREETITLDSGSVATIKFIMNLQSVEEASNVMFLILPYTITISILLSLCAAYIFAKALTKPIRSICASTKAMETLDENAQCMVTSQDEIGELALNINQLYASLQQTIRSLELEIEHVSKVEKMKVDFLRSASHELKTPLTSMSIMLENMLLHVGKYKDRDTYIKKCKELVEHLSMMIKDILDSSSLEEMSALSLQEEVRMDTWIRQQSEPYLILAKSKQVKMNVQVQTSFLVHVNVSLMEKVISNILANAVQNTTANHTITVTLQERQLCIYNDCTPIDEKDLPHIKEAFYRPDFSRSKQTGGNGLGLYFVDQILTMLNIPYTFLPYEQGMLFTIDLSEA